MVSVGSGPCAELIYYLNIAFRLTFFGFTFACIVLSAREPGRRMEQVCAFSEFFAYIDAAGRTLGSRTKEVGLYMLLHAQFRQLNSEI